MGYKELKKSIFSLVKEFEPIMQQAEKLGIFLGDRELLTCKRCGLEEDVLSDGRLIVKRIKGGKDTGLRFQPLGRSEKKFKCPLCKSRIDVG